MMTKYKVKTKAVFDGQPVGSIIELDEVTAKKYESLKYLEILNEVKKRKKTQSKSKKQTTSKKSQSATKKTSKKE